MNTWVRRIQSAAFGVGCALASGAWAAAPPDKANIYLYIDARKASGHPWHGPGDLIIPAPIKHMPTPITRFPEAPGAVLCIVTVAEVVTCPGARPDDELGKATSETDEATAPGSLTQTASAGDVEQFYILLQRHAAGAAPGADYRKASRRLFGQVVAPSTFCDGGRCPGERAFVEQQITRLREAASQNTAPTDAGSSTSEATRTRLLSPCPSSYDCEFLDIALPDDEAFGLLFLDPAMIFTNLIDGVIITRQPLRYDHALVRKMDQALRRAAATHAPPGPWEAKRRLRAFSVRMIEDCQSMKCRATQSDFTLTIEQTR